MMNSEDGISLDDDTKSKDVANRLARGMPGTSVDVIIASNVSQEGPFTADAQPLRVVRRRLPLPPVKKQVINVPVHGGTGRDTSVMYIRILYFTSDALQQVEDAVKEGENLDVTGYILDVRNDPGGVFEDAVAMSAIFLEDGDTIVETKRGGFAPDHIFRAGNLPDSSFTYVPKTRTTRPVVILTNDNSASASEVLTGALKGNGRATVVGMRTFGKGVVQYYFPMGDGSGLRLTVFKYLTPDGVDISREGGLIPDIQCNSSPNGNFYRFEDLDNCIRQAVHIIHTTSGALL